MAKAVYTAIPKYLHFAKDHIAQFVLEEGYAPLTPYGIPFWMLDTVDRGKVRKANETYVEKADEVWIFGTAEDVGEHQLNGLNVTDGVKAEKELAEEQGKKVRFFEVDPDTQEVKEINE